MLNAQKYIRMAKIAGLDLGTNSIGWAVVETEDNKTFELVDKGVRIFQEGVKIEKGLKALKLPNVQPLEVPVGQSTGGN